MKLPNKAVTLKEFQQLIDSFILNECQQINDHLIHKNCGGAIRIGFVNLVYIGKNKSLNPDVCRFNLGFKRVPYCENCDPPNGLNYTYARFVLIKQSSIKKSKQQKLNYDDIAWLLGTGRYKQ